MMFTNKDYADAAAVVSRVLRISSLDGSLAANLRSLRDDLEAARRWTAYSHGSGLHLDALLTYDRGGRSVQQYIYLGTQNGVSSQITQPDRGGETDAVRADLLDVLRDHEADLTDPAPAALAEHVRTRAAHWEEALEALVALAQRTEEEK